MEARLKWALAGFEWMVIAALAAGCSRSGIELEMLPRDEFTETGGSPSAVGGAAGAASRDAQPADTGGAAGGSGMEAGSVSDGAAAHVTDAADAAPLRHPPVDLVFSQSVGDVTSLYAMSTADFSVRKVDPPPPTRVLAGIPLGYSPDGRIFIVAESRTDATVVSAAYRCRDVSCPGQSSATYREVLRAPPNARLNVAVTDSSFAPDSSGMVVQLSNGAFYVPLDPSDPRPAVRLADANFTHVHFVGGSGALLAEGGNSLPSLEFIDLQLGGDRVPRHHAFGGTGGEVSLILDSISPDGEHWAASGKTPVAFAAADVLKGSFEGRSLGTSGSSVYAGDHWMAINAEDGVHLQRWDGSEDFALGGAAANTVYGCGNRIVLSGSGLQSLQLPGAATPALPLLPAPLPDGIVLDGGPSFVRDCTKFVARRAQPEATVVLVDLDRNLATDVPGFLSEVNAHGTLGCGYGCQSVERLDAPVGGSLLTFPVRPGLGSVNPTFAHDGLFFVAAAPLLDTMDPRIFRVDFSDPSQYVVKPLSPPRTELTGFVLSPDDRHLAYGVAPRPDVPVDPAAVGEGIYELDVNTGQAALVATPPPVVRGGTLRWQPIPQHRALLVMGAFADQPRESLYVANLEASSFVSQVPAESPPRVIVDTDFVDDQFVSPGGTSVWYRGVGDAPSRFLQPLRYSAAESLRPASVRAFAPETMAHASDQADTTRGFVEGIGPIYGTHHGGPFSGENNRTAVYLFDQRTGTERTLASNDALDPHVDVAAVGGQSGKVVLWRTGGKVERFSFLDVRGADPEHVIYSGSGTNGVRMSPDERWIAYTAASDDGRGTDLHFYDLGAHLDRDVSYTDIGTPQIDSAYFTPGDTSAFVQTDEDKVFKVELEGGGKPTLAGRDSAFGPQFSDDRQWAAWSTREGAFVTRLDGSLTAVKVVDGDTPSFVLSPSGRWLVVRDATRPIWRLFRTDAPDAGSVDLAESVQQNLSFDPTEKFIEGHYDETGAHQLTVWSVADPQTPHPLLTGGVNDNVWPQWLEGPKE